MVKAGGAIFQGKKDDNKAPIWVDLNAWKYTGKCLETLAKGDVVIITGSLSQESWTSNHDGQEKTKLVITCETIGKKVWANNSSSNGQAAGNMQQGGFQQPNQGGYNLGQQSGGYQGQQAQGGQYPSDDIPF